MRAVYYERCGAADVLQYGERDTPVATGSDLLVRVRASGVNPIDWKLRRGDLRPLTAFQLPVIPGLDVAGEVVEVGNSVSRFKPGDRVFGMLDGLGGGYAEFAVLPEKAAAGIPETLTDEQAAAVPLAALTALQALRDKGGLEPGDRIVINGASGGVGTFAVQIAQVLGAAEVVGVSSSRHIETVRSLGVDAVVDYETDDFASEHDRYDIIFDAAAKRSYGECKQTLRSDGRYVTTIPKPADAHRLALSLFTDKKMKTLITRDRGEDLELIRDWLQAGRVAPIIGKTFPLSAAADAHRWGEEGKSAGKIVLTED